MNKKGFTLAELLVTVVIILVIAGFSVYSYRQSLFDGENRKAKSHLELVHAAYKRYLMEYPSRHLTAGGNLSSGNVNCKRDNLTPGRLIGCGMLQPFDYEASNYNFFLAAPGNPAAGCAVNEGLAYMKTKSNVSVGDVYGNPSYCAGINKSGAAVDNADAVSGGS
jgi:prepilin-type N-terminal cleavage/methylation domain-containing protein